MKNNNKIALTDMNVTEERWPFSTEEQSDVTSRNLDMMLTKAKTDAEVLGLEFMNLAAQYKEQRKRMLMMSK